MKKSFKPPGFPTGVENIEGGGGGGGGRNIKNFMNGG